MSHLTINRSHDNNSYYPVCLLQMHYDGKKMTNRPMKQEKQWCLLRLTLMLVVVLLRLKLTCHPTTRPTGQANCIQTGMQANCKWDYCYYHGWHTDLFDIFAEWFKSRKRLSSSLPWAFLFVKQLKCSPVKTSNQNINMRITLQCFGQTREGIYLLCKQWTKPCSVLWGKPNCYVVRQNTE